MTCLPTKTKFICLNVYGYAFLRSWHDITKKALYCLDILIRSKIGIDRSWVLEISSIHMKKCGASYVLFVPLPVSSSQLAFICSRRCSSFSVSDFDNLPFVASASLILFFSSMIVYSSAYFIFNISNSVRPCESTTSS